MQSIMRRCAVWTSVFALWLLPSTAAFAQDATAAAPKRTPQSSNVVLGRDLIATTKSVEDLSLRLRLVQSLRGELERVRSAFDQATKTLPTDTARQTKLALQIKELQSKLEEFRAKIKQAEANAQRKPAQNPQLNPQPAADADAAAVPAAPVVDAPRPPINDAPAAPGGEAAPAEAGRAADEARILRLESEIQAQTRLLERLLDRMLQDLGAAENAPVDQPPDESSQTIDELFDQLSQYWREFDRVRRGVETERNQLARLEEDLASRENDMRSVEQRIEAAQLPILQGLPMIGNILPLGINLVGAETPPAQRQQEVSMEPPRAHRESSNPWVSLRSGIGDLEAALEIANEELLENGQRHTQLAERVETLSKRMAAVETLFANVTAKLQKELDDASKLKLDTEETLSARDDKYNQHQINLWLVWAVLLMAGAIPALFLLFRFYQPPVLALLLSERLFIEILSMAFLLLAIIILGTGNIITGEGLAGLLGTIAGYIFARKALEKPREPAASGDDLDQAVAAQEAEVRRLESEAGVAGSQQTLEDLNRRIQALRARMADASPRERMQLREEIAQLEQERDRVIAARRNGERRPQTESAAGAVDPRAQEKLKRAREELEMLKAVARRRRRE